MPNVVLYIFAGRRPNIELALPFYQRILDENPDTRIDIWDLARDPEDSRYLRGITGIDRLTVRTDYYQGDGKASRGQNRVWRHYTDQKYRDTLFVKADDDQVFWETDRYSDFIQAVADNPDAVVSTRVINNGASTFLHPELWDRYASLDIPLLDVHLSTDYAEMSHQWFHHNWRSVINRPAKVVPAQSWCSINAIGFHWGTGVKIAQLIGRRSPERIADREFPYRNHRGRLVQHRIGDEGAANMQPVLIFDGMATAHLTFGPQQQHAAEGQVEDWRRLYRDIARQYLGE